MRRVGVGEPKAEHTAPALRVLYKFHMEQLPEAHRSVGEDDRVAEAAVARGCLAV